MWTQITRMDTKRNRRRIGRVGRTAATAIVVLVTATEVAVAVLPRIAPPAAAGDAPTTPTGSTPQLMLASASTMTSSS